ncbi:Os07g0237166 [Oryza sativa Japonica Group]|uniref:Os07g0237166 protein n=1 Tax=Oryza sativa subsp. japonica TaxID=39947 RepID=A0A0P0X405_ORYSJ|nr:Os07g0237166 [Oryza sativa Japonica Group]
MHLNYYVVVPFVGSPLRASASIVGVIFARSHLRGTRSGYLEVRPPYLGTPDLVTPPRGPQWFDSFGKKAMMGTTTAAMSFEGDHIYFWCFFHGYFASVTGRVV